MDRQRVELVGRVVVQPELQKSKADKSYSKIRMAVNSGSKDEKGNQREIVTYYNVLVFGKRAERSPKLKKGALVRVVGDLEISPFLTKKGEAKAGLTVFGRELQVFDLKAFK